MDWIQLAQKKFQWRDLANKVTLLRTPLQEGQHLYQVSEYSNNGLGSMKLESGELANNIKIKNNIKSVGIMITNHLNTEKEFLERRVCQI
jgi:hypothetical protein